MSPRSEVDAETIRVLDPLVKSNGGPIPGLEPMWLKIKRKTPGQAIIMIGPKDDGQSWPRSCGKRIERKLCGRIWNQ